MNDGHRPMVPSTVGIKLSYSFNDRLPQVTLRVWLARDRRDHVD
jgi:hypothetical protein